MSRTLLLADDSVTIQRVIELTFAQEDVRVVSVGDGRRALEWMESERPDIVLVDVEVPDVDGYAVAEHVKGSARLKHVPVLLLAGAFEPVDQDRARSIGCDGVLVKPFEPQQLVTRVKDLLDHAAAPGADTPDGPREARKADAAEGATITPFRSAAIPRPLDLASVPVLGMSAEEGAPPEPLEPPARPVWEAAVPLPLPQESMPTPAPAARQPEPPPAARVSLVNAFSALLAAEQSSQPAPPPSPAAATFSDATVEDAVRRVLTRMTDDLVRRLVVETAERLIREEIEKIKANPE